MTPQELKEKCIQQREETVITLHRIEGAIVACNQIIQGQEKNTTEEETTEEETTEE